MSELAYCDRCEAETPAEQLNYPDRDYILWMKALGFAPQSVCDDCAEEAFDNEQERLASGLI